MIEHRTGTALSLLGLLGAGGQAREIVSYLSADAATFSAVSHRYLDSGDSTMVDVAAPPSDRREAWVIGAVGAPALRRELVDAWPGSLYATLVLGSAHVHPSCNLGAGTLIAPSAVLTVDVTVGDHCHVNVGATLSHDVTLGRYTTIGPGAHLAGGVRLGDGVFVGIGASIANRVSIANGVVVGAGAVVIADVTTANAVVAGVPARVVAIRDGWLDAI